MVCDRCITAVKQLLNDLKLPFTGLQLGKVTLLKTPSVNQMKVLEVGLHGLGFEILGDEITRIIEKIKTVIIVVFHIFLRNLKKSHWTFSNTL